MCLKRSTRTTRVFVGKDVFEAFYKKDPCVCRQRCV